MEYYDPDEVIPRNSPLLAPQNIIHHDPVPLEPWVFNDQTDLHYELWQLDNLLENEFLNRPLPDDTYEGTENATTKDLEADIRDNVETGSSPQYVPGAQTVKASSFANDNTSKPRTVSQRKGRKRLGLPLIVFTASQEESIIACPDSGSDDNIMSREFAEKLDLTIKEVQDPSPSAFVLANGRTVSAVGQVRLKCAFKQGSPANALIECVFYVFQTLAVPLIMGIQFLHSTETLTKHRDRLVEELVPSMRALRVCSIGRPKRDIVCRVGNFVGCATADTGSELDLVSPDFAASRAFHVEDKCVELEFADGSTGYTMGVINTAFSIGQVSDVEGFLPRSKEMSLELFILDNLNADVLVGTDTIQGLQAFSRHEDCFIPAMPRLGQSDLNIIRYIGAVERGVSKAWELLKDSFTSSGKKQATTKNQDHKRKRSDPYEQLLQDQLDNRSRLQSTERNPREGLPRTESSLPSERVHVGPEAPSLTDNAHSPTPSSGQSVILAPSSAYQFPESLAHRPDTDLEDDLTVHPGSESNSSESASSQYRCTFEGCAAPPFQTQYLLNAHANIHSPTRRYYCPIRGCPRSEGGKGFRRKNEVIRHGLVHASDEYPGYVCPFCPDRERDYPRPDQLQRHVRIHHPEKDAHDVELRDVLSQRPERSTRGRRRRGGPI